MGFLVHHSVLIDRTATLFNGKDPNSLFLHIASESARGTLFSLVYGKSNPSAAQIDKQWTAYELDMRRLLAKLPNTDVIFMGDINARVGCPRTDTESETLGRYGEAVRNASGEAAVQFLVDTDLVCLNNRTRGTPEFTYHQLGKEESRSIIDVICVSRLMYRSEYRARVIPVTLSGSESHYPIFVDFRLHRKEAPQYEPFHTEWNLNLFSDYQHRMHFCWNRDEAIRRWRAEPTDNDVEEAVQAFTDHIVGVAARDIKKIHVRHRVHKTRKQKKLERLRKHINSFSRKNYKECREIGSSKFHKLVSLRKQLKDLQNGVQQERVRRLSQQAASCANRNDTKRLFRTVSRFQSRDQAVARSRPIKAIADSRGLIRTKDKDIQQVFFEYWSEMFTNDDNQIEVEDFDLHQAAEGSPPAL